jgi:hypothetical protein
MRANCFYHQFARAYERLSEDAEVAKSFTVAGRNSG